MQGKLWEPTLHARQVRHVYWRLKRVSRYGWLHLPYSMTDTNDAQHQPNIDCWFLAVVFLVVAIRLGVVQPLERCNGPNNGRFVTARGWATKEIRRFNGKVNSKFANLIEQKIWWGRSEFATPLGRVTLWAAFYCCFQSWCRWTSLHGKNIFVQN